jgi:hypothetical protein
VTEQRFGEARFWTRGFEHRCRNIYYEDSRTQEQRTLCKKVGIYSYMIKYNEKWDSVVIKDSGVEIKLYEK